MNKQLALLKYKLRSCYDCREYNFDVNTGKVDQNWTRYGNKQNVMWDLRQSDGKSYPNLPTDAYYYRYEIHIAGADAGHVITCFEASAMLLSFEKARTFTLPDDYLINNDDLPLSNFEKDIHPDILSAIMKYERNRTEWQECVIIFAGSQTE